MLEYYCQLFISKLSRHKLALYYYLKALLIFSNSSFTAKIT